MSCEGCINTQRELNQQFVIVSQQAKEFAVKHMTNVFLYKTEEGFKFMAEAAARENGIQPTHGVVSFLQPVTT